MVLLINKIYLFLHVRSSDCLFHRVHCTLLLAAMAHTTISLSPLVHTPLCTYHSVHKGVHQYWPHLFWALSSQSKITWQICNLRNVSYSYSVDAHTEIKILQSCLQTLPPELPVNSSLTIGTKKPAKTCIDGQAALLPCMISVVKVTWRKTILKAQRYLTVFI